MAQSKFAYPTEFPKEEMQTLVEAIRNPDKRDVPCTAHCAWVVQGYAMSVAVPEHAHGKAPTETKSDKPLDKMLEDAIASQGAVQGQAQAVPWRQIGKMALQLLVQLLG